MGQQVIQVNTFDSVSTLVDNYWIVLNFVALNFHEKLQNRIFVFIFHELGRYHYTVGCDSHDYIFMKANFLTKFVKISCCKKFGLYGI